MIDETTREDAALFALDLLEGAEQEAFARKVAQDAELAQYVDDLRASATQLVKALPHHEPPGRLRVSLLNAVQAESAGLIDGLAPVDSPLSPAALLPDPPTSNLIPMPRPTWYNYVPWAMAACLGILAALSAGTSKRLAVEVASLRDESARASQAILDRERTMDELRQSLASAHAENDMLNLRVATLTSKTNPESLASVIWDSSQKKGIMRVEKLAATTGAAVYQLWAIGNTPGAPPVSAGTFTVSEDGSTTFRFEPSAEVNDLSTFAVSLEAKQGNTAPEGPIVLVGKM